MPNECYLNPGCVKLDIVSNIAGFNYRKEKGKKAATDLLVRMAAIKRNGNTKVIYHVDVVAHSMGFAYAQVSSIL